MLCRCRSARCDPLSLYLYHQPVRPLGTTCTTIHDFRYCTIYDHTIRSLATSYEPFNCIAT